jgi:hypothetical protein
MMFKAIKLLEPAFVDDIWRAYNIDDGLIVQEVCTAFLNLLLSLVYNSYLMLIET